MHLMILENKRLRSMLRPEKPLVSIGSNPECAVHLPDSRISQHQASLHREADGAWWLEIVDPSVPTTLNRALQKSRAKLHHADEIEFGIFSIRFFMETHQTTEEVQRERMTALSRQHGESLPLGAIIQRADQPVTVTKEQLEQLTLLGLKLANVETLRDLIPSALRAAIRLVGGRRAWIGIRPNDRSQFNWVMGITDQGQPCDRPPFSQTMEPRCLANTQYICCPNAPIPTVRSAMAVPLACESGTLGMIYIENDMVDAPYEEAALHTLRPVENTLLRATAKRQAVVSTEQTIARVTQDGITPRAMPQWDELQIAAYRHMGTAKCCDLYDLVQLPDKTASILVARLGVEGVSTPRYLAEVRAAFRAASLHGDAPHLFCRALNWMLFTGEGKCRVDLATAWINPNTGKVQACVAGEGVPLIRIHANGEASPVVATPAAPIGKSRTPTYDATLTDLSPGDTLLWATAGLNLATGADGKPLGIPALQESVADGVGDRPGAVLNEFQSDFTEFIQGGTCPEDVTVLLARWK
jgi:serine phosphatase RsbU (regulator of sigma subunit)